MAQARKAAAPAPVDATQADPDVAAVDVTDEPTDGDSADKLVDVDEPAEPVEGVTLDDVAALAGVSPAPVEAAAPPALYVNEGMRAEIEMNGHAFDPTTGRKVTAEDLAGVIRGY